MQAGADSDWAKKITGRAGLCGCLRIRGGFGFGSHKSAYITRLQGRTVRYYSRVIFELVELQASATTALSCLPQASPQLLATSLCHYHNSRAQAGACTINFKSLTSSWTLYPTSTLQSTLQSAQVCWVFLCLLRLFGFFVLFAI